MYVEADMLYSYLKPSDWLKEYAMKVIDKYKLSTSVITIVEIELVSKRDFGDDFANSIAENLEKLKNLEFIPLKVNVVKKAIEYRKKFGLNIFDSLHAASAFVLKKDILSTDRAYDLIDEIKRVDPREFVSIEDDNDKEIE